MVLMCPNIYSIYTITAVTTKIYLVKPRKWSERDSKLSFLAGQVVITDILGAINKALDNTPV